MIGQTKIRHSLDMIARSRKRLIHQQTVVGKLSLDRDPELRGLATEMLTVMENKLSLLLDRHAVLLAEYAAQP